MQLSDKIKEIADGYALLTHKPQGWEGGASMEDYLRLREQALKEIGYTETAPILSSKTVTPAVASEPKQPVPHEGIPAEVKRSVAPTPKEKPAVQHEKTKKSDLDILKSLGE